MGNKKSITYSISMSQLGVNKENVIQKYRALGSKSLKIENPMVINYDQEQEKEITD